MGERQVLIGWVLASLFAGPAFFAAAPGDLPPAVDADLLLRAAQAPAETWIELVLWLRARPGAQIARQARQQLRPEVEAARQRVRALHRSVRPQALLTPAEEQAWIASLVPGQSLFTPAQRAELESLGEAIARADFALQQSVRAQIRLAQANDRAVISARIHALGGRELRFLDSQNAVVFSLPAAGLAEKLAELAAEPRVARVIEAPRAQPELDLQGQSLGLVSGFWSADVDGDPYDVGILDTGIETSHPALAHVAYASTIGISDPSLQSHGTGVAGIVYSADPTYRGVASGILTVLLGAPGLPDADWMVSSAPTVPAVINLSFGFGPADDEDDSSFDQFWDGLIDDHAVQVAKSAGNAGDGVTTLTHPAAAYNLIAVTNMNDQNTVDRGDDWIHVSSSRGPSLAGRKKPDLTAPGHTTMTTSRSWATGPDFFNFIGTSAAAPHVTGAVALLTDLRAAADPMASKAVLIQSADTWSDRGTASEADDGPAPGSEWNKVYGWGYLDLGEAWFNGLDVFSSTIDDGVTPPGPDFRLYAGTLFADEKSTLVWHRHVGYNGNSTPTEVATLSDLDLFAYRSSDGTLLTSSESRIDNVEQIAVAHPEDVVLKVAVVGEIDPDVAVESYALATEEGFYPAVTPSFSFTPTGLDAAPGQAVEVRLAVHNLSPDLAAFANATGLTLPPGFSLIGGSNPQNLGTIGSKGTVLATWTLAAPCAQGVFPLAWNHTSASYGEVLSSASNTELTVSVTPLAEDTPFVGQVAPKTFSFVVGSAGWTAVALLSGGTDHVLVSAIDPCLGTPYQTSATLGVARELILANGQMLGGGTHHAGVGAGSGLYTVETDAALDVTVPGQASFAFAGNELIETLEIALGAGRTYRLTADVTAGTSDPEILVFRPDQPHANRATANFVGQARGNGEDETLVLDAPVSGDYAVVITNLSGQAGNLTFKVQDVVFHDRWENGNTNAWSTVVGLAP